MKNFVEEFLIVNLIAEIWIHRTEPVPNLLAPRSYSMDSLKSSLEGWMFFPNQQGLSVFVLVILLMAALYMMRPSIHYVITQLMTMVYSMFRIGSRSLGLGAQPGAGATTR